MFALKPTRNAPIASLLLLLALNPAAQAAPMTISRDTGVGAQIAAQGNQALLAIRADVKRAVRAFRPALPAQFQPVSASAGGSISVAPGQRCAK